MKNEKREKTKFSISQKLVSCLLVFTVITSWYYADDYYDGNIWYIIYLHGENVVRKKLIFFLTKTNGLSIMILLLLIAGDF